VPAPARGRGHGDLGQVRLVQDVGLGRLGDGLVVVLVVLDTLDAPVTMVALVALVIVRFDDCVLGRVAFQVEISRHGGTEAFAFQIGDDLGERGVDILRSVRSALHDALPTSSQRTRLLLDLSSSCHRRTDRHPVGQ
jgi:hypothetical protein